MDHPPCTFCQTPTAPIFRVTDLNRKLSQDVFSYYRCAACGLIFLWPHPSDLGKYYPDTFHTIPTSLARMEEASRGEMFKLLIVQEYVRSGRLLEIGSSYGGFAYVSKGAGFEVDVIEMDPRCCDFLNSIGVKAINVADPVNALQAMGTYDVIALWQVIEHLPNPWETMRVLADHLSPKGILILAAPNPDSLQFRLLGRRWPHVDAPRHLSLIPISLLHGYAGRLGLESVSTSTRDPGSLHWNRFGWEVWLANLVSSAKAKHRMRRIGDFITRLVRRYERRDLNGSTYTLVFQRP